MVYKNNIDPVQKRYWPSTKAILTQYKSDTGPVQKQYWPGTKAIPFEVPLHNVSVPAVPEPVTSPVLVYGTGTCTGTVCKTCIERNRIGTLYRIQRYRTSTTYHRWTVPERVPIDTGMFTGRAPLLCYFKLYASFRSHRWIQAGLTVRKRPIWVKIDDFFSRVTLQCDVWPWKTIGHLFYATSSFVHHFLAIGDFKLELQSGNTQFGSNSTIFRAVWPWNLMDDLEKQ